MFEKILKSLVNVCDKDGRAIPQLLTLLANKGLISSDVKAAADTVHGRPQTSLTVAQLGEFKGCGVHCVSLVVLYALSESGVCVSLSLCV